MTPLWTPLTSRWARLISRWARPGIFRDDRWKQGGYVAVMVALSVTVLMGIAAFAVDVGRWYLVGQQEQRAADAAAMSGVTSLPSDSATAFTTAQNYSKINGFENAVNSTVVTTALDGRPTRLRVTVNRTVKNFFGSLLGVANTTITRSAVADFAGPVPMGSPCNTFGNDPDPGANRAATCSGVLGAYWANINSRGASKVNGDAYQGNVCASTTDGCSGSSAGPNVDFATDGYYYTVSVKTAGMSQLNIELFDPVFVATGLLCDSANMDKANEALNPVVTNESTRYASGASSSYCTGDAMLGGTQVMNTQFTVRSPGASPWDVTTFPAVTGCQKTYTGFNGALEKTLYFGQSEYNATLVDGFRRWTTLCTINNPEVGDYLIQVKSSGYTGSFDTANATNHFAMRAYGSAGGDKENLSISGREKMGIYANAPGATTEFYLARVPSSAAGQTLRVRLYDVGDSSGIGTIKIISPPDATGGAFTNCVGILGSGPSPAAGTPVNLASCSLSVQNSTHNGKWQAISVPIPSTYTCTDADTTKCWVRLQYVYGSGNQPNDVTSWTASIEGDPVRLVE